MWERKTTIDCTSFRKKSDSSRKSPAREFDRWFEIGINEPFNSINVKINRGAFPFSFFLQCIAALGVKSLLFDDLFSTENK